jgi:dimeric type glycyl-tRNA synthetase
MKWPFQGQLQAGRMPAPLSGADMPASSVEQIRNLCKTRGFVFPGSAAYGGLGSFWDYGPLGVELLNNIKQAWWQDVVYNRDDVEGLDAAILMSRKVWQHSGHEETFADPLVDNKASGKRPRLDHLLREQSVTVLRNLATWLLSYVGVGGDDDQDKDFIRDKYPEAVGYGEAGSQLWRALRGTVFSDLTPDEGLIREVLKFVYAEWKEYDFFPLDDRERDDIEACIEAFDGDPLDFDAPAPPINKLKLLRAFMLFTHLSHVSVSPTDLDLLAQGVAKSLLMLSPEKAADRLNHYGVIDPDTREPGDWTSPRLFNLMFVSHTGPVEAARGTKEELASRVYLRPETAQGIFLNFNHVQRSMARKLPFGIAQIGKAFRNEITPGNFIFRTREFEQMEIEFFIKPPQFAKDGEKTDDQWHEEWIEQRFEWWQSLGIDASRLRKREQTPDELAHYAKRTVDIEYLFPGSLGWGEIEGVANRTDYDLTAHSKDIPDEDLKRLKLEPNKDSVEKFDYFDPDAKARYIPWVIEPSAGATRAMLTVLCEAYDEELVKDPPEDAVQALRDEIPAVVKNARRQEAKGRRERTGRRQAQA